MRKDLFDTGNYQSNISFAYNLLQKAKNNKLQAFLVDDGIEVHGTFTKTDLTYITKLADVILDKQVAQWL
jgi:hypothetical protein